MLGRNPENVTSKAAYSQYYITSSFTALRLHQINVQDFHAGLVRKEIDRYILEKIHSQISAKMRKMHTLIQRWKDSNTVYMYLNKCCYSQDREFLKSCQKIWGHCFEKIPVESPEE